MGSSKKKSAVVGYWYHMDLHLVVCDEVDEVVEIQVGGRTAWSGSATDNTEVTIDKETLFGGESREGGWKGKIEFMFGGPTQVASADLKASVAATGATTPVPGYRKVLSFFFKGWERAGFAFAALNPYYKPPRIRARRHAKWYPAKAKIGTDANPVHMVYEALTNRRWGMGYPTTILDDTRLQAVADTLYDEGFGLSILWDQATTIEDFILDILKAVGGALNQDRETGKLFLTLARDDYDVGTLQTFDPDNCRLEGFTRAGAGDIANEITLTYTDKETGEPASVTVQNLASILDQGRVVAQKIDMPMIRTADIAVRVAQRELQSRSRGLAKVTLETNRKGYSVYPGAAVKLDWPDLGISSLVLRVTSVDVGDLESPTIRIEAVEDVFGLPSVKYVASPGSGWVDTSGLALPVSVQRAIELPYYLMVLNTTQAERDEYPQDFGFGILLARAPQTNSVNYEFLAGPTANDLEALGTGDWTPNAILASGLGRFDTGVALADGSRFDLAEEGDLLLVNNELMEIASISYPNLTVRRGVLDTFPGEHTAGDRVWLIASGLYGLDLDSRVDGETAYFKALTRGPQSVLPAASAPVASVTMDNRFERPYPPGNVQIDGQYYPATLTAAADHTVSWAHRDRTQQTASPLLPWTAGSTGPEAGVTYRLRVYDAGNSLVESYTGLTGTSQAVLPEVGDPAVQVVGTYRVELETDRGGVLSKTYSHTLQIA